MSLLWYFNEGDVAIEFAALFIKNIMFKVTALI
jgi:hypothetical protein